MTGRVAALEQALRSRVIEPYEGMHAIDQVLLESPLKYCGDRLAHQSLAPGSLRQVERQLRPAVCLRPVVETAGADELLGLPENDSPPGQAGSRRYA